jgi:hypothetical protein
MQRRLVSRPALRDQLRALRRRQVAPDQVSVDFERRQTNRQLPERYVEF